MKQVKFVCDNCKAKYQIGDDKVAGKTLRMKCRRCGHLIQVAASVTEGSVSTKLPTDSVTGSAPAPVASIREDSGAEHNQNEDGGATIVKQSPLFLFQEQNQNAPFPSPSVPRAVPSGPGIPRPSGGGLPAPMGLPAQTGLPAPTGPRLVPPARPSARASSPPAAPVGVIPRAPMRSSPGGATALAHGLPAPQAALAQQPSIRTGPVAVPAHTPSSPALYGGFAQAVSAPSSSSTPLMTEDWYVGIAGVPLGPVRLSVLREKAAQGQVDAESLVWREGFEEWQAVKKIPGLLELVEEAKHQRSSRTSGATPVPPAQASPPFKPPSSTVPGVAALVSGSSRQTPAPAPVAPTAPSSVGSAFGFAAPSAAPSFGAMPEPAASHPFDLVRPSGTPLPPTSAPTPSHAENPPGHDAFGAPSAPEAAAPTVMKDPFAFSGPNPAAPAPAPSGYGLTTTGAFSGDSPAPIDRASTPPESRKKKGMHPMVWAFIAMAAAFGGVAAWALFLRDPNVVYVKNGEGTVETANNGSAPPAPPTNVATSEATSQTSSTETATPSASTSAGPPVAWTGKGPPPTTAKTGETSAPIDTSGFGGTQPPGPKTSDTSTGNGGGALTGGQAEGVIARNSPRVRRSCWDPQVSSRSADAPRSVKVNVTMKVAPSGKVTSASVSGGNEKAFPGLNSCVQNSVSGWSFPPSDEGGTFSVPFSFNAQ